MSKSTERFSNRVEDYVRYRPHYPQQVVEFLEEEYGVTTEMKIADIGAGTGISSELFLKNGYHVTAVEPNKEMREKAVELLRPYKNFSAINGTAEDTTIKPQSVDVIIAGQAFHWFDVPKTKAEFQRILKPKALVGLIWNERLTLSPFEKEYDELIIKHARDYVKVDHRNITKPDIDKFFEPATCELKVFYNYQILDFEGLKGRLLSSSYMPSVNDDGYTEMIADLKVLFDHYKENNLIKIEYDTKLFVGLFN
jgi:ubiquinone/menaquinone biosynthesis C-methylase UbiE